MQARGRTVAVLLPDRFDLQAYTAVRNCMVGAGGETMLVGYKKNLPLTDSQRKEV